MEDYGVPDNTLAIVADPAQPEYNRRCVAMVVSGNDECIDWQQCQANAALMASSPDLLDHLKSWVGLVDGRQVLTCEQFVEAAVAFADLCRPLIAEADGETGEQQP